MVVASIVLVAPSFGSPRSPDRLELFRSLAASRLSPGQIVGGDDASPSASVETYREIYALLDEEIVEGLASGGPFAALAFLQDRLDAFSDAWGGASIKLQRLGDLVVGAFQLGEAAGANSVRAYGRLRDEAALLTTLTREGRPHLYPVSSPGGGSQLLVAWEGPATGHGARTLRLDLVRPQTDGIRVVWSTAELFPDALRVRWYRVRGGEIRVRYLAPYPGWVPGCEAQTEQEDVYRLDPATATYVRASRREHDAWHRELRQAVGRLLAAIAANDRDALASLVPDAKLRAQLPRTLRAEPACDAVEAARAASVAATAEDHRAWTLTFQRSGARWHLTAAAPVLP